MTDPGQIRFLSSLRSRILLLALLVCALLLSALAGFYLLLQQTESTIVTDSSTRLLTVVNGLAKDYLSVARQSNSTRHDLDGAQGPEADERLAQFTTNAFRREPGVEGGFYSSATADLIGYAFPTNDGPGPKRDIPPRERPTIAAVAQQAASTAQPATSVFRGQKDTILFQAVPIVLDGRTMGSAWGMKRIHGVDSGRDLRALLGVSSLALAAMACVAVAFWITRNVQGDVSTIQDRLKTLELDLTAPREGKMSTAELNGILGGIDRLGKSLQQKIATERELIERLHHKERLASLGQVAAGVAHELRNPLATIRLRTQMSLRTHDPEQLNRSGALIMEEIDRLSSVLDRLLYFAKPIQLLLKSFDPGKLCDDLVQALKPEAEHAGIEILCSNPGGLRMTGDALKLHQVLENIIRNAMESFENLDRSKKLIGISIRSSGGYIRIEVQDSGSGLPPGVSTKVFDPFFTTKGHGTGLGLSIANEIIRAHSGTLSLQNGPTGGAVAAIALPLAPNTPQIEDRTEQSGVRA